PLVAPVDVADVAAADPGRADLDEHLPVAGLGHGIVPQHGRGVAGQEDSLHGHDRPLFQVVATARPRRATTTLTSTAPTMITPRTTFCRKESTPSSTSPLPITVMNTTPSRVPSIPPRPPASAVPPITTAAITSNSSPDAAPPLPEP